MNKRVIKKIVYLLLVIALQVGMPSLVIGDVPSDKTWKLVWGDEFNGTKIDPLKWQVLEEGPSNLGERLAGGLSQEGQCIP